ncbi:hypothetical protein [Nanchangia anserum]|uniref:Uncharacterized protein n=1 Tax=Nanchangia anserum TaxID=2692125 RepID=A0A8I0KUJ5_9ACTO|nr:hypothetical protein [Nanchangia anserum]MBD3689768.1 hypothetical protein [Nanchangia anserum]
MDGHSTDEASTSVGEATATVTEAVNRTSHVAYSVLTELAWARERARREENALKAAEARADRQTKRGERMTAGLRRKVEAAMKKLNDPEVAKEIAAGDELGDLLEQGRAHVAAGGSREEWDKVFNTIEKSDREAARQWRERFDTAAKEYETANPVNGDAAGVKKDATGKAKTAKAAQEGPVVDEHDHSTHTTDKVAEEEEKTRKASQASESVKSNTLNEEQPAEEAAHTEREPERASRDGSARRDGREVAGEAMVGALAVKASMVPPDSERYRGESSPLRPGVNHRVNVAMGAHEGAPFNDVEGHKAAAATHEHTQTVEHARLNTHTHTNMG